MYHLSFTGLFHAENGHGVSADIIREAAAGTTEHLGRSFADSNEKGVFGLGVAGNGKYMILEC